MDIIYYITTGLSVIIYYEWVKELFNHILKINYHNNMLWLDIINSDLIQIYSKKYNLNFSYNFVERITLNSEINAEKARDLKWFLNQIYINPYINYNTIYRFSYNYENIFLDISSYEIEIFLRKMEFIQNNNFFLKALYTLNPEEILNDMVAEDKINEIIDKNQFFKEKEFFYPDSFKKNYRKYFRSKFTYSNELLSPISDFEK